MQYDSDSTSHSHCYCQSFSHCTVTVNLSPIDTVSLPPFVTVNLSSLLLSILYAFTMFCLFLSIFTMFYLLKSIFLPLLISVLLTIHSSLPTIQNLQFFWFLLSFFHPFTMFWLLLSFFQPFTKSRSIDKGRLVPTTFQCS